MRLDKLEVITLFVYDIDEAKAFYRKVFAPRTVYEDEVCAVFDFGGVMINILRASEAPQLVEPSPLAPAGARFLLTVKVENVDAACGLLAERGVPLLNGPIDRPWGRRTAAFADPAGHVWEIAQDIA